MLLLPLYASRCSFLARHLTHGTYALVFEEQTASWATLLSSSVSLVLFSLGCSGHRLLSKSQSGPANQFPLSIFTMVAPLLQRFARFNSDGQYFQVILTGPAVSDIFFTLFGTNTFHPLPGLIIQYSATILSIQMLMVSMGHRWRAVQRFFAMFTAIWPLTSSSLAIDVLLFDIRDFEVRSPLVRPASCSTTATAAAQHARMLASAKICKWTAPISPTNEAILLGTLTSLSCFVHLNHWFFNLGETSAF